MPAVGKTYWGKKIADEYGLSFVDLDMFIEEQEKMTIPELFAQYGEAGFRERESRYLKEIVTSGDSDTIIACGGGTPCFNDNMALLRSAGTVIYLQVDIPYLLQHINEDDTKRPLLSGKTDLPEFLGSLLQQRQAIYEQAHFILHTQDISLITFGKIISSCINRH
ncbi:MAG: shikimate kinase [Flavipsychrobacter sp.]|nr:shikimate kinase [Flavipsychrobacter sp.]